MLTMQDKAHECIRDNTHIVAERQAVAEYKKAQEIYLCFLRQKAKERWIDKGDENTKVFHQSIRARRTCNKIYAIQKNTGEWVHEEEQIKDAFVQFYKDLLGTHMEDRCGVKQEIMNEGMVLNEEQKRTLCRPVTTEDVKRVLMEIPNEKAPGNDGYSSFFFKHSWEVVGSGYYCCCIGFFPHRKVAEGS